MFPALRCPVCRELLEVSSTSAGCANGHSFDRARQGYLNLVTGGRQRSSGDSRAMLEARRNFLRAGHYDPLVRRVRALVTDLTAPPRPRGAVLDLGCGEGHYLRGLVSEAWHELTVYGLDISKEAVRMAAAAERHDHVIFLVGSAFDIPLADAAVDVVVKVFAPAPPEELARLVSVGGAVLEVLPGPRHLAQLRAALYDTYREHETRETQLHGGGAFRLDRQESVRFDLDLDAAAAADLLAMTPYAWHTPAEAQQRFLDAAEHRVSADFDVRVFHRLGTAG